MKIKEWEIGVFGYEEIGIIVIWFCFFINVVDIFNEKFGLFFLYKVRLEVFCKLKCYMKYY